MKLIGNLKDKVDKAKDKEKAKKIIADAGMELTDDELEMVAGGSDIGNGYIFNESIEGWEEVSPGLYTDGNGRYVSPVSQ